MKPIHIVMKKFIGRFFKLDIIKNLKEINKFV